MNAAAQARSRFDPDLQVCARPGWHGFALTLKAALQRATTPFVFVIPHDMQVMRALAFAVALPCAERRAAAAQHARRLQAVS